jgi:glycosyltransferase involved in cell wall biosynthesis
MSDQPLISVVTPSFNQAAYLRAALDSVLSQHYPQREYLVYDGGSTDGSQQLLADYAARLDYLQCAPDGGQSAALAAGFARARGDILGWLNADDRLLPGTLQRVAAAFARDPRLVFVYGDVRTIDRSGAPIGLLHAVPAQPWLTANSGLHGWPQPGSFWRRSAYELVGGLDAGLQFSMDRDLFLRLARVGRVRRLYGPPLAEFRLHDEAKSSRLPATAAREHILLVARYGDPRLARRRRLFRVLWRCWYGIERLRRRSLEALCSSRASVSA